MGAWGPGLYSDDIAQDIRNEYKDLIKKGKTDKDALSSIMKNNEYLMDDEDDGPIFWFALADTLWNLGRLEDFVKEKALFHLKQGNDLKRWKLENPKGAKKREKVLDDLEKKLRKPQPERKNISKQKIYKCEWKIGDVYAYPLLGDESKESGLYGKFLLLIKNGETTWHPGNTIPIVRIKITNDNTLPKTEEEINQLDYIKIHFKSKKNIRDIPLDFDENDKMWIYQCIINNSSKRIIPKSLIYLGNFENINMPQNEYIYFKSEIEIPYYIWKSFESCMNYIYKSYNI